MNILEPLISIIIPAYNAQAFLQEAIQSCINQTHTNLEIIIIDDGSTDKTLHIAHHFANTDSRIHVFTESQNHGTFAARAKGIEESKGEFITFLDSDDYINPEFCAKMLAAIMRKGNFMNATSDFAVCHYFLDDIPKIRQFRNKVDGTRIMLWSCLYRRTLLVQSLALCRRVFGEILEGLYSGEDTLMGLLIISFVRDCSIVNEPLYHYRQHQDSVTHSKHSQQERLINFAKSFDYAKQLQAHPAYNPALPIREFARITDREAIYEFYILQRHESFIAMLDSEKSSWLRKLPPYPAALLSARRYKWRWRNDFRFIIYCLSFGNIKR